MSYPANNLMPGELLHSFLLRQALMQDNLRFRQQVESIVNNEKMWLEVPRIPKSQLSFYESVPSNERQKLVHEGMPGLGYATRRIDPIYLWMTDYVFRIKGTKANNRQVASSRTPIKFCRECFQEQLWHTGFTWFRHWWFNDTLCLVHRTGLRQKACVKCPTPNSIATYLYSLLSGTCPTCKSKNWGLTSQRPKTDLCTKSYFSAEERERKARTGPHPAPCYLAAVVNRMFLPYVSSLLNNIEPQHRHDQELLALYNGLSFTKHQNKQLTLKDAERIFVGFSRHSSTDIQAMLTSYSRVLRAINYPATFHGTQKFDMLLFRNHDCAQCPVGLEQCHFSFRGYTNSL